MRRPLSSGDRQLLAALGAAGFLVRTRAEQTAWQRRLEDWRQHGLYPRAVQAFGGGGGSTSLYSDAIVDQVVEAATLMAERSRKAEAALILFYRGREISDETARRAHLRLIGRLDSYLRSFSADADPLAAAEATAAGLLRMLRRHKTGRTMLRQFGGRAETRDTILLGALTNIVLMLRDGHEPTSGANLDVAQALQLDLPAVVDRVDRDRVDPGWLIDLLRPVVGAASLPSQAAAVASASGADLKRAHNDLQPVLLLAGQLSPAVTSVLTERFVATRVVPLMLTARANFPWVAEALGAARHPDGLATALRLAGSSVPPQPTGEIAALSS